MFTMFNTKETTEGRRIEKVDAIAGTTRRYYYDDQRVAVQTLVSGSVETDERYFVFGNYIDETLVMHVIPAQAGTQDLYYAHDHLYSPVALFAANGSVAERYEYDAYGKCQILNSEFLILNSSQHGTHTLRLKMPPVARWGLGQKKPAGIFGLAHRNIKSSQIVSDSV